MMERVDLDLYFNRIGHGGAAAPTLATLQTIHRLHPQAIPFENLDSFLGQPVRLDLPSLQDKLLRRRRGGYCFEQNRLLATVLAQLGFRVECLAARVRWNAAPGEITARRHMLLVVHAEGAPWLVDVGFGGVTLTGPVRIDIDTPQATPHETFRVTCDACGVYTLSVDMGSRWREVYTFERHPQHPVDYEVSNWYVSTHPSSVFLNELMLARALPGLRLALGNWNHSRYPLDAAPHKTTLLSCEALIQTIEEDFGIEVDNPLAFKAMVQRKLGPAGG